MGPERKRPPRREVDDAHWPTGRCASVDYYVAEKGGEKS